VGFLIHGHVLRETNARLAGLAVILSRQDRHVLKDIATSISKADGSFTLEVPDSSRPDGYQIRFQHEEVPYPIVSGPRSWRPNAPPSRWVFRVRAPAPIERLDDPAADPPSGSGSVRGVVQHESGTAVVGVVVKAYQRLPGASTLLGSDTTNGSGRYAIPYEYPELSPDIFVVVEASGGGVLRRSTLYPDAKPHLRVDLRLAQAAYRGPTEYAAIHAVIGPHLSGVDLTTLDGMDVARFSLRGNLPRRQVAAYLAAQRLATELTPSAPALYGLLRQGAARSKAGLVSRGESGVTAALQAAAAANQISDTVAATASQVAEDLLEDAVALSVASTTKAALGPALAKGAPSLTSTQRSTFVRRWQEWTGTTEGFWTALEADPDFDASSTAAARGAIQFAHLSLHHPSLVEAFRSAHGTDPKAAAGLSAAGWISLMAETVDGAPVSTPSWVEGGTETERRAAYASLLVQQARGMFPSERVRRTFLAADPGETQALTKFLRDNPDFHFRDSHGSTFFTSADLSAIDPGEVPALKTRVRRLQRLYRLAPLSRRSEAVAALETAGLGSAREIARMSRRTFVDTYGGDLGGAELAAEVHNRAKSVAGAAEALWSRHDPRLSSQVPTLPKPPPTEDAEDIPDYDSLFGHIGGCQCEHCASIVSPAAYFVDLLRWLEERDAYATLDERRPDLKQIELSCDNTDTVLPFVDLAIEILETAVVNRSTGEDTVTVPTATTRDAEELLSQPEHVHAEAYTVLQQAVWPQDLPYDHPAEQVRETLRSLGLPWADLIARYRIADDPSDAELAILRLGGSAPELARLLDSAPSAPHPLWGYTATSVAHPHPDHSDVAPWYVALRWVPEVLARGDVESFEDLRDLLHARYVQGSANPFEILAVDATTCEVTDLYLGEVHEDGATPAASPGAVAFTRLQAFLRLRRRTGYTALDLDKVLHALGIEGTSSDTGINAALVVALADLEEVRRRTGSDLAELSSWWSGALDRFQDRQDKEHPVPSLYDRLFLDPSRGDPAASLFALNSGRTELLTTSTADLLANHEAELVAALRTTASELADAAALVLIDLGTGTHLERKLDHLSRLFRKIRIAQAARLPVHQAFRLVSAIGADPEEGPALALAYLEQLAELRQAGLDPAGLLWVLSRDPRSAASAASPSEEELQGVLGRLRDELRALANEAAASVPAAEATQAALRQELTKLVSDPVVLDTLVAILAGEGSGTDDEKEETVRTHLGTIVDVAAVRAEVIDGGASDALVWSLDHLRSSLLAVYQRQRVEDALSPCLGLELEHVRPLERLALDALAGASILETLTAPDFVATGVEVDAADPWGDLTREAFPEAFHALDVALGAAWLLRSLELSPAQLALWLRRREGLGLLRLEGLPVEETPAALAASFPALRRTALLFQQLHVLSADETAGAWLDQAPLATLFTGLETRHVASVADAISLLHRFSLGSVVLGPPLDRTASPQSVTVGSTTVLATAGSGWASDDAALVALRDAVRADPTVGTAAGAGQQVDADCLDGGGVVTNGTGAGGNPAVSLRLSFLPGRVADISSPTAQSVTAALLDPLELQRWSRALAVTGQLGVSADEIATWATHEPDQAIADGVRAAARGRYASAAAWTQGFRPVRDALRKRQQAALVSWLLSRDPEAETEGDLHGKYLIDMAMDPCAMSSRLVQAIASVQLFVQRCFLGLESGITLQESDAAQWQWMKQYRLWEAARHVFLYPENWLRPELRLTKSALFEAAEARLLEEDPTPERVARVAARFLEQLHALANPEVIAVWQERVGEGDDIVHLLAHTQHKPPRAYYRRYEHDAYWTPWEELPFEVPSKTAVLFVASQRTLLLWVEYQPMSSGGVEGAEDEPYLELRFRWSERLGGEWSAVRQGPTLSTLGKLDDFQLDEPRIHLAIEVQETEKRVQLRIRHRVHAEESPTFGWEDLEHYELSLSSGEIAFTPSEDVLGSELDPSWPFHYSHQGYELQEGDEPQDNEDLLELPLATIDDGTLVSSLSFPLMTRARKVLRVRVPPLLTFASEYPSFVVQDDLRSYLLRPDGLFETYEGQLERVAEAASPGGTTGKGGLPSRSTSGSSADFEGASSIGVLEDAQAASPSAWWADGLFLAMGFHLPFVDEMLEQLRSSGISALYRPDDTTPYPELWLQGMTDTEAFQAYADPSKAGGRRLAISRPRPIEQIDFSPRDGGALYHWEFFYHLPMLISRHPLPACPLRRGAELAASRLRSPTGRPGVGGRAPGHGPERRLGRLGLVHPRPQGRHALRRPGRRLARQPLRPPPGGLDEARGLPARHADGLPRRAARLGRRALRGRYPGEPQRGAAALSVRPARAGSQARAHPEHGSCSGQDLRGPAGRLRCVGQRAHRHRGAPARAPRPDPRRSGLAPHGRGGVLLHAGQRRLRWLPPADRRSPVQDPPLHEPAGRGEVPASVRAPHRPGRHHQRARGRGRPRLGTRCPAPPAGSALRRRAAAGQGADGLGAGAGRGPAAGARAAGWGDARLAAPAS
jgi:hypothetical protein